MDAAVRVIKKVLGGPASEYFADQLEDFIFLVRSKSFVEMKVPISDIKKNLEGIIRQIIERTVKTFLVEKYGTNEEGSMKVIIEDNKVYDENGHLVKEIPKIIKAQPEIISILIKHALEEFEKGRALASNLINRSNKRIKNNVKTKKAERDYLSWPPFENLEIEILRLEKKLPLLSTEEGRRLSDLYERLHNQEQLEQELLIYGAE